MGCCFGPAQKLYWKWRAIPPISEPRSASSACSIPGTRNSNFIPMSTVSFPPADSPAITPAGFAPTHASSFPSLYSGASFAASSSPALKSAFQRGQLHLAGELAPLTHPKFFAAWLRPLFRKDWIVYSKPPFGGPEYVLQYLGRYTHRVAISNHRLVSFDRRPSHLSLARLRPPQSSRKLMSLSRDEFLRRFLLHLLPKGFVRIRHFGFLANRRRAALLPRCFAALHATPPKNESETSTAPQRTRCGAVPSAVDRWPLSNDSQPHNSNSVLHRSWPRLHEITRPPTALLGALQSVSPKSVSVSPQTPSSCPCLGSLPPSTRLCTGAPAATPPAFTTPANFYTPRLAPFNLHRSRVRRASGFLLTAFSNATPHTFFQP